jgi:hypothetical protein
MTHSLRVAWLVLLLSPLSAFAAPDGSLTLEVAPVSVKAEWQVRLHDLDATLQLDVNHDGEVTWAEIENRRGDIESYLAGHLNILANGRALSVGFDQLLYGAREGEPFLLARLQAGASQDIETVGVNYSLPAGQCVLKVVWPGRGMQQATLSAAGKTLNFTRDSAAGAAFVQTVQRGVWHIWTGYDHILFLLVLLIPAVFRPTALGREAVSTFHTALLRVVIIVSAFTVAHSITLACAALGWIRLPSRLVESVIAASIFIAALNNLLSRTAGGRSAWLAFGFGLIHGFGFAGALSEIGAEGAPLWRTLLAFNLGVEAGQLAIVAVFLPVAFSLRQTQFYRSAVLYGGSCAAGLCALFWFWERATGGSI